jgi:hypothetical protein
MKTLLNILLIAVIFPIMAVAQNSYTIKGRLLEQVTETISTPPVTSTDCDGNSVVISTPDITTTRLRPRTFTTITIKVFLGTTDVGTPVRTYSGLSKSTIEWNGQTVSPFTPATSADTGRFEYEMTAIPKSRINYTAFVYLDGGSTSVYSEEFLLSSVPGIPLGTIWAYMGDGTDLTDLEVGGWFLCDGRDIDADLDGNLTEAEQDDLIALFTRSGKHEPGKLPDLRGRFLRGMDKGAGNDPNSGSRTGGNVLGSIQGDEFKSHDHTGTTNGGGDHRHWYDDTYYSENRGDVTQQDQKGSNDSDNDNEDWITSRLTDWSGDHSHGFTTNTRGGAETRPKNVFVNYIIKCVK